MSIYFYSDVSFPDPDWEKFDDLKLMLSLFSSSWSRFGKYMWISLFQYDWSILVYFRKNFQIDLYWFITFEIFYFYLITPGYDNRLEFYFCDVFLISYFSFSFVVVSEPRILNGVWYLMLMILVWEWLTMGYLFGFVSWCMEEVLNFSYFPYLV